MMKLLSCPFCGSIPTMEEGTGTWGCAKAMKIICGGCGTRKFNDFEFHGGDTPTKASAIEKVIAKWNMRAKAGTA